MFRRTVRIAPYKPPTPINVPAAIIGGLIGLGGVIFGAIFPPSGAQPHPYQPPPHPVVVHHHHPAPVLRADR